MSGRVGRVAGGFRNAVSGAARGFWTQCDLRTMLQRHADDPAFLRTLREQHIPTVRLQLERLRTQIDAAPELRPRFKSGMLGDISKLESMLNALAQDRGFDAKAALKLLLNVGWLWPILVPSPLLANQPKTFAYTQAAASKAVLAVGGSLLRPTSDGQPWPLGGGELGHHSNEVHFYPALLNFVYGAIYGAMQWGHGTRAGEVAEKLEHSAWFHVLMAVTCGAVLSLPFVDKQVKLGRAHVRDTLVKTAAVALGPLFQARADAMRADLTPGQINDTLRLELRQSTGALVRVILGIERERSEFTGRNKELTRTVNSQVTRLLDDMKHFAGRVEEKLQLRGGEVAGAPSESTTRNPDFASKVALTLFAALITGATVVLIQPDRIGTVDLAADAVVVTAAMMLCTASRSATRQDAMERFKGMAATSMVMCLALGGDKIATAVSGRGLIDRNDYTPYVAGALMSLMAWTLPGPVARTAELALSAAGRQVSRWVPHLGRQGQGGRGQTVSQGRVQIVRSEGVRVELASMAPQATQQPLDLAPIRLGARPATPQRTAAGPNNA